MAGFAVSREAGPRTEGSRKPANFHTLLHGLKNDRRTCSACCLDRSFSVRSFAISSMKACASRMALLVTATCALFPGTMSHRPSSWRATTRLRW